jgi:hypothetical protein
MGCRAHANGNEIGAFQTPGRLPCIPRAGEEESLTSPMSDPLRRKMGGAPPLSTIEARGKSLADRIVLFNTVVRSPRRVLSFSDEPRE